MRKDLDPFHPEVKKYVIPSEYYSGPDQIKPELLRIKDQVCSELIPFEVKITKSKDDGRGNLKYGLFCKRNLRIYNNIGEYMSDLPALLSNSKHLDSDITTLTSLAVNSVALNLDEPAHVDIIPFVQS